MLIVLGGMTAGATAAANPQGFIQDKFRAANQADLEQARDLYLELLDDRVADPVLFAKLGSAYAQLGQPGRAVLMYERALRLDPRNYLWKRHLRQIEPPDNRRRPFVLVVPFLELRDYLTLDEWAWLAAGCWSLLALLIAGACLLKAAAFRRLCKRLAWAAAVLLLFVGGMLGARCWSDQFAHQGIVLEYLVSRFGPGLQYQEHLELPAGRRVRIISQDAEWAEIAVPGTSQPTYIESSHLEEI
jgi:tetratricopeptide (TPR) repeat protein